MEGLSKMDKYILAYLWHEYFGALYYSSGKEEPETFLAKSFISSIISERAFNYQQVLKKAVQAIEKLKNYWLIEVSGYEIKLTSYGQQVASSIGKEEYEKLKKELSEGKFD